MPSKVIRFSSFEVDLEQRELRKSGARVPLQHKPFRILELLLQQPGALVRRRDLAKELWPGLHVNFEHGLNSAMNTLRQVLGDSPRESRYIETRSGLGYRFIAPIENGDAASSGVYQDCLRGRFFLNKRTASGVQRAIGCFQSALKENSAFSPALSGLADSYSQLVLDGTANPAEFRNLAAGQIANALTFDPDSPQAYVALARVRMIFEWNWTGAAGALQKAFELDPDLPDAYLARAQMFAALLRYSEALADIRLAETHSPLALPIGYEWARVLFMASRFTEAVSQAWAVLSLEPNFSPVQEILGLAYAALGAHDEAVTECENACACSERHPGALASLSYACASAGDVQRAQDILHELQQLSQRQYISPCLLAVCQTGLRDHASALYSLHQGCRQRDPLLINLTADPRLFALRSEPDFANITQQVRGSLRAAAM